MYRFDLDLREGQSFRKAFADCLTVELGAAHQVKLHNGPEYDIEIFNPHGIESYLTCKHEPEAKETGKIAVEYERRRKPSGIRTTKADCWCFLVGDEVYSVMTDVLRYMFKAGDFPREERPSTKVMLVPLPIIRHWSLTKENLYDGLGRREKIGAYYY